MHKDKYCGEVYLELTFWSNVCLELYNTYISNFRSPLCLFRINPLRRNRLRVLQIFILNMEALVRSRLPAAMEERAAQGARLLVEIGLIYMTNMDQLRHLRFHRQALWQS